MDVNPLWSELRGRRPIMVMVAVTLTIHHHDHLLLLLQLPWPTRLFKDENEGILTETKEISRKLMILKIVQENYFRQHYIKNSYPRNDIELCTKNLMASESNKESSCNPPVQVDEIIFAVTFLAAFALLQLPYDKINSDVPVPRIIFKDKPSLFHAFLLALNFAFTGAVMAICTRRGYPKMATRSRGLSIVSAATAAGVLTVSVLQNQ